MKNTPEHNLKMARNWSFLLVFMLFIQVILNIATLLGFLCFVIIIILAANI